METYNGKLISADFEESTMEFEIQHEFTVKAGDYVILHKADYEKLVSGVESENGKLPIPHVVGRSEQLAAFLKWYYENDECPDLVTYEAAAERFLSR